ncbi:MAG TPA: hypothetical protein VGO06_16040 [Bosea sp. (in: a-proteobacteria)]|jgi:hypothetical protein|uniref:hypothetical protein n=1 Tax=Bosea sp. (in: a-proteobacteria) TaxID=1871050 RepID=UPI002E0E90DF|nr:hypothetical protein [Bosea sp. (in: a-proteobacteria)]
MLTHETDHASTNFAIQRTGDLLSLRLSYPPYTDADNPAGKRRKVRQVEITQSSTRSSDGIRVIYDYARDGWVIEQPRCRIVEPSPDPSDPEPELLEDCDKVAFVRAWGRQQPGDLPWLNADDRNHALRDR